MKLFNQNEDNYGSNYKSHLLEQWKTCVEMADKISERRNHTNNFYLTLNTTLITISIMFKKDREVVLAIIGLFVSCLWIKTIKNYKILNSQKFEIINDLEKELPSSPYDYEWTQLDYGSNKKRYCKFTNLEMLIPKIFFCNVYNNYYI